MRNLAIIGLLAAPVITVALFIASSSEPPHIDVPVPLNHTQITATVFWVGETATSDNAYIPNDASAWDGQWQQHYGGIDTPDQRQQAGKWPAGFTPKENPFYVALPYGDFDENGVPRPDASLVPWYSASAPSSAGYSIIKNHWVKIVSNNKTVYAQWEDVGPMSVDDFTYVFGSTRPEYQPSGIDLSPATANHLGIDGKGVVSWKFVSDKDVPAGPWKEIITTRQMSP